MKTPTLEPVGTKFGRWTILKHLDEKRGGARLVLCRCECNTLRKVMAYILHQGKSRSCGCFRRDEVIKRRTSHGKTHSPEYQAWINMRLRCQNKKARGWHLYGGRGIKVCAAWDSSFERFYEDMGDKPFKSAQLDRSNNDGDYCKDNCRWVAPKVNAANRRDNIMLSFMGETLCLKHMAQKYEMRATTLHHRLKRGLSLDDALKFKVSKAGPRLKSRLS